MMKPIYLVLVFLSFLSACKPASTPQATKSVSAPNVSATSPATLPTGSQNMQTLDACGFTVSHPALLIPDGQGYQVMFQSNSDPQVSVLIQLRRRDPSEADVSLETLALHLQIRYFPEMSSLAFEPITVTDIFSNPLAGLQRDIVKDGVHTRLMVVVRPNTLLADLLPGDVIYELVAQAPEDAWAKWGPLFDAMLQSLQPRDCGGV
ncbi:MAG: hypothetical protein ABIG63_02760 [Chloroflexota bacterium]